MSRCIGDPDVIWSLALLPFSGQSQGFAPTMWKADSFVAFTRLCADDVQSQHDNQSQHHMPSPFPFCYLQVILPLAIQWLIRAPVKLLGGAVWRPCSFTLIHCLTGPVGQLFASRLGGQRFASQGCTHTHNWTRFFCKRCLATGGYFFLFWESKNGKL